MRLRFSRSDFRFQCGRGSFRHPGAAFSVVLALSANGLSATEVQTYKYDELGRLVAVQSAGTVNNERIRSLCYDPAGNRLHYNSNGAGIAADCSNLGSPSGPSVSVSDAAATEGGNLVFTVSLSAPHTSSVSTSWSTADGTALAAQDYTSSSGTLTFAPGQSSQTITIATLDNSINEPTEVMYVNLVGISSGSTILDGQGVGSIADNDSVNSPPTVTGETRTMNVCSNVVVDVVANDTDPDGDVPLYLTGVVYSGALGEASVASGSSVAFLSYGAAGTAYIQYTISDSRGATASGTLTIGISNNGGCN